MLRLGDTAPDFEAACHFPEKSSSSEKRIKFSDFCADSWVILFSHPADFTPVCTTELARVNLLESEWSARSCKVIGLSTDSVESHSAWSKDICAYVDSICECVRICACGRIYLKVSTLYGMLDQESHDPSNFDPQTSSPLPIRTVFILDPKRRVRLTMTYPASVGRSFTEILRVLDALQRSDAYKIATPANWKQGEDVIVRFDVKDEEADLLFPSRSAFNPYLRFTPDPKK
ncbi:oxidoreductase [Perkinsus sp. BL_2016]|nr:oxidoreductase [Perkinsus sp. BL_2016]